MANNIMAAKSSKLIEHAYKDVFEGSNNTDSKKEGVMIQKMSRHMRLQTLKELMVWDLKKMLRHLWTLAL